ncbi:acyl-CoA dehydrogenase [Streptomyces sp. NPDC102441]|uniref:acyl-CoA dehydrogenase n=1 Tax=Streptomyces sp. NPDC102441 TaxID=3366176 RepID=UPI00380E4CBA
MATLAANADHQSLAAVARSFLEARGGTALARTAADAERETLPSYWPELDDLGWLGLHLPEEYGGQGFGLAETAVVLEEFGRVVAPGPFLPTVVASAVIARAGTAEQRRRWLPALASGALVAAVGLADGLTHEGGHADGEVPAVLGAPVAGLLLLASGDDLLVLEHNARGLVLTTGSDLDPAHRVATVRCTDVAVDDAGVLPGARPVALAAARALAAAEAGGIADACTLRARDHALARQQFGRPVGSFQAIKHHCANMLVDAELATAAAWGAVGRHDSRAERSAGVAAAQALPAAVRCAQLGIQIHGALGYTWEHESHLFLKRALALVTLFGGGAAAEVAGTSPDGVGELPALDLPAEETGFREAARSFRARLEELPAPERPAALVESGYAVPHWPKPFGRDAGPVEQLVIEEELPGVRRPDLGIGSWILPTLIQHGTPGQLERWVRPALREELRFCQLFSEPGAGSDAASLRTRARRTDGGWLVDGQKTWTSDAHRSHRGLLTVRTDPDAPKHAGVSMMVVDLAAPGVLVRPVRDLTGGCVFNEVFLDDVFVPDEDVVGEAGAGWAVARATIGNERVSIGTGLGGTSLDAAALAALSQRHGATGGPLWQRVGELIAEEEAMALLNLKHAQTLVSGLKNGTDGNVGKLLSAEHAQRITELALALAGPAAVGGGEPEVVHNLLYSRGLSIGGGTSEISRNQIAERVLRLPRERY